MRESVGDLAVISAAERSFCTFQIEGRLHGIEVAHVREVSPLLPLTPVAHTPPSIRGLVNLRSRIYLVLDLRPALGLPPMAITADSRLIILKQDAGEDLAILVETGGDIIRVRTSAIESALASAAAATETPADRASSPVTGVCKLEKELVLIVDPIMLIDLVKKQIR